MADRKISVVVPIRNEEKYISACLTSLLQQTYPDSLYEVIVVDGRSSDRSREIVRAFCEEHANVLLLDNPAAIVPCGMNLGIRNSQGEIIVRADGHNVYPKDYLENCVKYLEQTGADNVGGPWVTVPADASFGARLVAAILTSPFGVGDSRFRTGAAEGYVETVPFGAFRKELFLRIGVYNEKLVRNQDNELNARIRQAGGKIFQTPALSTEYRPVAGFWQLLRVTYRTSQWHLFSMKENSRSMSLRHLAPAVFVTVLGAMLLTSAISHPVLLAGAALLLAYLFVGYCMAGLRSHRYGYGISLALPLACLCFHMSYGMGTLAGVRFLIQPPTPQPIREGQSVG
jgi:glycosyltransferase involved in cell wall biosynthesis